MISKYLVRIFFLFVLGLSFAYLILPTNSFPAPPPDSIQSTEEADTETPLRRAYFTNYSRAEVIDHYRNQFPNISLGNLILPSLRLNYPPEEAQTLIRDQTRSSYLEELAHPLRESIFINGFQPQQAKDDIWYQGVHFEQKIIIRQVPSSLTIRLLILPTSIVLLWLVTEQWLTAINDLWLAGFKKKRKQLEL